MTIDHKLLGRPICLCCGHARKCSHTSLQGAAKLWNGRLHICSPLPLLGTQAQSIRLAAYTVPCFLDIPSLLCVVCFLFLFACSLVFYAQAGKHAEGELVGGPEVTLVEHSCRGGQRCPLLGRRWPPLPAQLPWPLTLACPTPHTGY